jgi:hypothetical protein
MLGRRLPIKKNTDKIFLDSRRHGNGRPNKPKKLKKPNGGRKRALENLSVMNTALGRGQ